MSDIKGRCLHYIDDHELELFPTTFVDLPRVGDFVRSTKGTELQIAKIIHLSHRLVDHSECGGSVSHRVETEASIEVILRKEVT